MVTLEEAEDLYRLWSSRLAPKQFALLGGEPTLHKGLVEHLELAARYWKPARLLLVTNGSFLHKFPNLPETLSRLGYTLHVSKHSEAPEYLEKWNGILDLLNAWKVEFPRLHVNLRHLNGAWQKQYNFDEGKPVPFNSKRKEAFEACIQRTCTQIRRDGLYKCAALANFAVLSKKFGLENDSAWDKFRNYKPATAESTEAELKEMLAVKPIAACSLCPGKAYQITHSNPLLPKI
jgi:hypothetical protein